jgi:hypothetical protein
MLVHFGAERHVVGHRLSQLPPRSHLPPEWRPPLLPTPLHAHAVMHINLRVRTHHDCRKQHGILAMSSYRVALLPSMLASIISTVPHSAPIKTVQVPAWYLCSLMSGHAHEWGTPRRFAHSAIMGTSCCEAVHADKPRPSAEVAGTPSSYVYWCGPRGRAPPTPVPHVVHRR